MIHSVIRGGDEQLPKPRRNLVGLSFSLTPGFSPVRERLVLFVVEAPG